ncbi:hypothetical protein B7P43_G15216 [Cryptotermes secundus]|uniref:Uncharacterized protein n=1 Tax=Cryptotermes secundus TaxID=105785 RepID=A0A2J7QWZ9_9NEOP|nr:hypothetical protein B7P43_G15216 [Cryptotermes secundus]
MTATHRLWTVCLTLIYLKQVLALDATLVRYNESPGLYYERLGEAQLYNTEWKIITYVNLDEADKNLDAVKNYHRICKQKHPIRVTHLDEDCEAEMLQPIRVVPASCSRRIVEINQTIWTQLDNNEWLYVAPRPDTLTVLCSGREPTDLEIVGTGKFKLNNLCKAYGTKVLIQAQMTVETNSTERDIIPHLFLDADCCQTEGKNCKP